MPVKDAAAESRLRGRAIKNEIDRKNRIYSAAEAKFELNFSEEAQKEAAELFAVIPGWRDSDKKRQAALERAESIRSEKLYKNAMKLAEKGDARSLEAAAESMKQIADWQDAVKKAKEFEQAYSEVARKEREKKEYQERTERNRKAYDEQFAELLAGEEEVTLSLMKAEEKLKALEGNSGIKNLIPLDAIAVIISLIGYALVKNGQDDFMIKAGIFFGPATILLSIASGISGAVIRGKVEKEIEELEDKLNRIRRIPGFEEYNKNNP